MITKHRTAIVAAVSVLVMLVLPVILGIVYALYMNESRNISLVSPSAIIGTSIMGIFIFAHYSPMVVLGICTVIFGPRHVWDVLVTGRRTITTAAVTASAGFAVPALLTTIHSIYVNDAPCFTNVCPFVYVLALVPLFIFYYYLVVPGICAVVFGLVKRKLNMSMGRTIVLAYSAIAIYYVIVVVWIAIDPDVIPPIGLH